MPTLVLDVGALSILRLHQVAWSEAATEQHKRMLVGIGSRLVGQPRIFWMSDEMGKEDDRNGPQATNCALTGAQGLFSILECSFIIDGLYLSTLHFDQHCIVLCVKILCTKCFALFALLWSRHLSALLWFTLQKAWVREKGFLLFCLSMFLFSSITLIYFCFHYCVTKIVTQCVWHSYDFVAKKKKTHKKQLVFI